MKRKQNYVSFMRTAIDLDIGITKTLANLSIFFYTKKDLANLKKMLETTSIIILQQQYEDFDYYIKMYQTEKQRNHEKYIYISFLTWK